MDLVALGVVAFVLVIRTAYELGKVAQLKALMRRGE